MVIQQGGIPHLTCKVANKCLDACERIEVAERYEDGLPYSLPCYPVNCHLNKKQKFKEMKIWEAKSR